MATPTSEHTEQTYETDTPEVIIANLRAAIAAGEPWYTALLGAIGRWRLPAERVDERQYRYLVGGEAFDWLLLAERLTDDVADLIPEGERAALVYGGHTPFAVEPEEMRRLIGPAKYRALLNFLYGITVEEALQLDVEEDVHKEHRCRVWGMDRRVDETVFERIYGHTREDLLREFRAERGIAHRPVITFTEEREFTYWLFKYRLAHTDPARIASDTKRGLNRMAALDALRRRASPYAGTDEFEPVPADITDSAF